MYVLLCTVQVKVVPTFARAKRPARCLPDDSKLTFKHAFVKAKHRVNHAF